MGIKLAESSGFCMGVRRAMDIVLDLAQHKGDEKIYTYGPLIHNPQTVELLEKRGVIPVDNIDDIHEGTIVIRAHGISLAERQKIRDKGIKIIDATCPKVARVQAIIKKHAALGYTVVIAGDKDHPEVIGLLGYASGRGVVISSEDEIDLLADADRVCIVAQTTQNVGEYEALIEKLKERFPSVLVFNTICDSTEQRQEEIRRLASEMDAMIVVGGRNSANTTRLAEIAGESGAPAFHVETAEEIKKIPIHGYQNIGVSAGASTPNWIIDGIIDSLTHYREEASRRNVKGLYRIWMFAVRTDIYSAIGAGCLSLVGTFVQNLSVNILNILVAASYVFAMHTINRLQDKYLGRIKGSFREALYIRYKRMYVTVGVLSLLLALALSFLNGLAPFFLLFFISLLGLSYNIKVLPDSWRFKKMGDIPGSKNVFIAVAWAVVTVVVPQIELDLAVTPQMIVAFLFVFTVVFVKSALSDVIDIQSDRLVGNETIPVVIGEDNTQKLLKGVSVVMAIILFASYLIGYGSSLTIVLLVSVIYVWICIKLCAKRTQFSSVVLEGLLETNYIIAGLSALTWYLVVKYVI